jgi:RNA polymerase sigma-70 factor (ECF subfamily)
MGERTNTARRQNGALPAPLRAACRPGPPLAAAAANLNEEIAALYEEYASGIAAYSANRAAGPDMGGEIVQETFLRYLQARQRGEIISNPRAWLFRVARNYLLDQLRKDSHTSDEAPPQPVAGRETDPESLLALANLERNLKRTLSARELECSLLRASGFSYEEIAAAMRLRPGTVGAMLSRAGRKLANLKPDASSAAAAAPAAGRHHSE